MIRSLRNDRCERKRRRCKKVRRCKTKVQKRLKREVAGAKKCQKLIRKEGKGVNFKKWSTKGKIYSVQINATCLNETAILKKGTNVKINFTFSANAPQSYLTSKVFGQLPLIPTWISFPLANSNGCKDSGLSCPIEANKKYQFLPVLEIKSAYPAISVKVKWELLDRSGQNIFCVKMDTHIMS